MHLSSLILKKITSRRVAIIYIYIYILFFFILLIFVELPINLLLVLEFRKSRILTLDFNILMSLQMINTKRKKSNEKLSNVGRLN